jgi:hypothetical protein
MDTTMVAAPSFMLDHDLHVVIVYMELTCLRRCVYYPSKLDFFLLMFN